MAHQCSLTMDFIAKQLIKLLWKQNDGNKLFMLS